jgi:hypothetical protein
VPPKKSRALKAGLRRESTLYQTFPNNPHNSARRRATPGPAGTWGGKIPPPTVEREATPPRRHPRWRLGALNCHAERPGAVRLRPRRAPACRRGRAAGSPAVAGRWVGDSAAPADDAERGRGGAPSPRPNRRPAPRALPTCPPCRPATRRGASQHHERRCERGRRGATPARPVRGCFGRLALFLPRTISPCVAAGLASRQSGRYL